jgi:hypothetical protein
MILSNKCIIHGKEDCWVCTDPEFERFPYLEKIKENPFVDEKLEEALDKYREFMTQDPNTPTSEIREFDKRREEAKNRANDLWERSLAIQAKMQESEGIDWVGSGLTALLLAIFGFLIIALICLGFLTIDMTFGGS